MMGDDFGNCDGCGTAKVLAPGIDTYCPNKQCDYEMRSLRQAIRESHERHERAEYERLKAKYEGTTT